MKENSMTEPGLLQYATLFPFFRNCAESGDCFRETGTGCLVANSTAENIKIAFEGNDMVSMNIWTLTEYFYA